jgi:hypothetical protein
MSTSSTSSKLELTGLSVISGERMHELEIENDEDEEEEEDGSVSERNELNEQFTAAYYLQNEVAAATHKTYVLHMNASV